MALEVKVLTENTWGPEFNPPDRRKAEGENQFHKLNHEHSHTHAYTNNKCLKVFMYYFYILFSVICFSIIMWLFIKNTEKRIRLFSSSKDP